MESKTEAKIRQITDDYRASKIGKADLINAISPQELNAFLLPSVNPKSVSNIESAQTGLSCSNGAAVGRVFFSTASLLKAYNQSKGTKEDHRFILIQEVTYANDVRAIELGQGVITSSGGYSSHAPVIARSLGKPAAVLPGIEFHPDHIIIEGHKLCEGEYITIDIHQNPVIYFGKGTVVPPSPDNKILCDYLKEIQCFSGEIKVMANIDSSSDVELAKQFGSAGIGLCRTEHMFLRQDRIQLIRSLLKTDSSEVDPKIEDQVGAFLKAEFKNLIAGMSPLPITIRLLDAPIHEFFSGAEEDSPISPEVNPLMGNRGCRIAITHPHIYELQVHSILEAAFSCSKEVSEAIDIRIMVPMIGSEREFATIKNGKKLVGASVPGIEGIVEKLRTKYDLEELPFQLKIGTMIELPSAALSAGEISRQAEFISFGTNDLTQLVLGISRDDIHSFLPAYTKMDIWRTDPFQKIEQPVKDLISFAIRTSKLTRPDIEVGVCGEQATNVSDLAFFRNAGVDYLSCSPYAIPSVILGMAQEKLKD